MKFIKNIVDQINPTWLEEVLAKEGKYRPREGGKPQGLVGELEWQRAIDAGYNPDASYFQMFDKTNCSFDIPAFYTCKNKTHHWWITKMMPGDFMPMHIDPHTEQEKNAQRFWIPLQDWDLGHVFVYEDQIISNYKTGDMWEYENPHALHGAANIGLTTRVVLQITVHEI